MRIKSFKRIVCGLLGLSLIVNSSIIANKFYETRYVITKDLALFRNKVAVVINDDNSEVDYGTLTSSYRSYIDIFKIFYSLLIYDDRSGYIINIA